MNLIASCLSGPNPPVTSLDLLLILESRRESALVSIDILVSTLFPDITTRTYKRWIVHLDEDWKCKRHGIPRHDKREALERAIVVLDMCLAEGLLPKTRVEIYQAGKRVTKYKREVLKLMAKKVKM